MNRPSPKQVFEAREVIRADKKAVKAERGPRVIQSRAKPLRERDPAYMTWLHEGLSCIACLVIGEAPIHREIEAAHQKINSSARGLFKRLGRRPPDWQTCPLCRWHHREGPLCCDPAQAKFWAIIGLEPELVADLCRDLYAAFRGNGDGEVVIRRYAGLKTKATRLP